MKIDRLIGILSLLLQCDRVTAPQLAERFEVSERTIRRDIDSLCQAGIPIVTHQGVGGGISIMDGYRIDRTVLTSSEMQAILAGLRSLDSISGSNRYALLMEKLSAGSSMLLPGDNRILIDLASWSKSAVTEQIELIHSAIDRQRKIRFHYISPAGDSRRRIEPYYLLFHWSSWYVWGWCEMREDFRLFKLQRMENITIAEAFSPRPVPLPDISSDRVFPVKYSVKALVAPEYRWRLIEEYGKDSFTEQPDGMLLLSCGFTDKETIVRYIASFGGDAELLEPKELRSEVAAFGKRISQKHSET